jgi:osmotically-inducible protein OsmY
LFLVAAAMGLLVGCSTAFHEMTEEPVSSSGDRELVTQITSRLEYDAVTAGNTYGVSARDGAVTLSGSVHDEAVRSRALAIVRETPGVTEVIDKLQRR